MSVQPQVFPRLLPIFGQLLSKPCWGIAAGAGTGTNFTMHFGKKVRRAVRVDNSSLNPDLQKNEGEMILFVECDWVVRSRGRMLFDSKKISRDDRMVNALKSLIGQKVDSFAGLVPLNSMTIIFHNRATLSMRTSRPDPIDPHDNLTLFVGDRSYTVASDLSLREEPWLTHHAMRITQPPGFEYTVEPVSRSRRRRHMHALT